MVIRRLPSGAVGRHVRLLASVFNAGLTAVDGSMCRVTVGPGGSPLRVMLIIGVP